jgi:hypothetical protein
MLKAFAYANGRIGFGQRCGNGSVELARSANGSKRVVKAFKNEIECSARHGYAKGVLLVPGVPEAKDQEEGMDAVLAFKKWLRTCFLSKPNPCGLVL